jgi:hypothetical protein
VASLYRCPKYSQKCPAEVLLRGNYYLQESSAGHTHIANIYEITKARVYAEAKAILRLDPKRGVDSIVSQVLSNYTDVIQRRIKRKNLERALYLAKSSILTYPRGPTSPANLSIPEEWAIHPDGEDFVIGDFMLARTSTVKAERVVIFSHPRNLRILSESNAAAGDGTFEMRFRRRSNGSSYI